MFISLTEDLRRLDHAQQVIHKRSLVLPPGLVPHLGLLDAAMAVMGQEIQVAAVKVLVVSDVFQQFLRAEVQGLRLLRPNCPGHILKAGQDVGTFDMRDVGKQPGQERLILLLVRKILVHHPVKRTGGTSGVGRRSVVIGKALIQKRQVVINALIQLPGRRCVCEMHPREQLVEFPHGAVPGHYVGQKLDRIDGPDEGRRKRSGNGRIIVVLPHDGQVHGLRIGDTHFCMHGIQQVHIEKQVSRYGRNQPQGGLVVGRMVHAGRCQHITHAVVDGHDRSGKGERRDSAGHHFAHIPLGKQMTAYIIIPVKLLDVNNFRSNRPHLQQIEPVALDGPFQVFFFRKYAPDLFARIVQQPHLFLRQQPVGTGPIALAGNLVAMGGSLPGNQVFPLPAHRLDQDVRSLVGIGRKEDARLFAVHHFLDNKIHPGLVQVKMAGVILHTVGLQGGQAAVDAFQQMTAIDKKAGLILSCVGNAGPVFIGGR